MYVITKKTETGKKLFWSNQQWWTQLVQEAKIYKTKGGASRSLTEKVQDRAAKVSAYVF